MISEFLDFAVDTIGRIMLYSVAAAWSFMIACVALVIGYHVFNAAKFLLQLL
jgi:hypothetical protein